MILLSPWGPQDSYLFTGVLLGRHAEGTRELFENERPQRERFNSQNPAPPSPPKRPSHSAADRQRLNLIPRAGRRESYGASPRLSSLLPRRRARKGFIELGRPRRVQARLSGNSSGGKGQGGASPKPFEGRWRAAGAEALIGQLPAQASGARQAGGFAKETGLFTTFASPRSSGLPRRA